VSLRGVGGKYLRRFVMSPENEAFLHAVRSGDHDAIRCALEAGPDLRQA